MRQFLDQELRHFKLGQKTLGKTVKEASKLGAHKGNLLRGVNRFMRMLTTD